MRGTIIGLKPVDYVKKDTQQPVKGVQLIITCRSNDVIGLTAKEEFIKADSSFYKDLIAPYLSSDVEKLINASVFIDYNTEKRGSYTFTDIVDMEITPAPENESKKKVS